METYRWVREDATVHDPYRWPSPRAAGWAARRAPPSGRGAGPGQTGSWHRSIRMCSSACATRWDGALRRNYCYYHQQKQHNDPPGPGGPCSIAYTRDSFQAASCLLVLLHQLPVRQINFIIHTQLQLLNAASHLVSSIPPPRIQLLSLMLEFLLESRPPWRCRRPGDGEDTGSTRERHRETASSWATTAGQGLSGASSISEGGSHQPQRRSDVSGPCTSAGRSPQMCPSARFSKLKQ